MVGRGSEQLDPLTSAEYILCIYGTNPMKSRVQKWGNSLALRIPKSFAAAAGLAENTAVRLSVHQGKLVVQPHDEPLSLDRLLAGVTDENLHSAWETGGAVGKEAW